MRVKVSSFFVLGLIVIFSLSSNVFASDLNGIGIETSTEDKEVNEANEAKEVNEINEIKEVKEVVKVKETEGNKEKSIDTAKAVGDMFSNAGVDKESVEKANEFIKPFATFLNKVMAVILGATSLLMMFVTVLDLLYMAFPPVRDLLDGGTTGGQQIQRNQSMRRTMPMGPTPNFGMPPMPDSMIDRPQMSISQAQQGQVGGGLSALGRWVSDEAIAACVEGKGFTGGGAVKLMIFSYLKKRSMFLILFGVCVVLFTSTVFTDLGIKIGTWLLGLVMGIGK